MYFVAAVPDSPERVELVMSFPTMIILRATPPEENGGIEVFGYRVEYEDKAQDFSLGETRFCLSVVGSWLAFKWDCCLIAVRHAVNMLNFRYN